MRRPPCTSKYSAVVLSSLLAVACGSALQSSRNLQPDNPGAKVHCWSDAYFYGFVLPASEVTKHFPNECQDPLSCNTTCVAKVPARDVCTRLKSRCTLPDTQPGRAQNENNQLASVEKNVERRFGEIDVKLAQLILESVYHKDKLVNLGNNLNNWSDARKKQSSAASIKSLDSPVREAAEIEDLFDKKSKSIMTAISSVLSLIQGESKMHLWTLKGYAEKKARATKTGNTYEMCDKVYIRRYLIAWGIYFKKSPSGVNLELIFQIHRGINDEFLQWPFPYELKLRIIHPESGKIQQDSVKPLHYARYYINKHFSRPTWINNVGFIFTDFNFDSSYLESKGYVKTDQLLLKLELD